MRPTTGIISTLATTCLLLSAVDNGVVAFTLPTLCTKTSHHSYQHVPLCMSSTSYSSEPQIARPIDIEENALRDISTFETWAYNYGIQRDPGFQLTYNEDGSDIFAITSTDMPAGSCALYVPEELILSSSKAMAELQTSDMQQAEKILYSVNADTELRQYYLMVKILVEYEKGENSPWFPWLNS